MSLQQIIASITDSNSVNLPSTISHFLQSQSVASGSGWSPAIDMIEDERNINIFINIAGVTKETLDIEFFNNVVLVSGERVKPYTEDSNVRVLKSRILYGPFTTKINMPISVTSKETVTTSLENGVLRIVIDKTLEERNRFSVRLTDE
jgi:HSP20 family molecular chaperone IbpA